MAKPLVRALMQPLELRLLNQSPGGRSIVAGKATRPGIRGVKTGLESELSVVRPSLACSELEETRMARREPLKRPTLAAKTKPGQYAQIILR